MPIISGSGSGGGGGKTVLYDSGYLAAPAASIDSGAGGFSTSFTFLYIYLLLRSDETGAVNGSVFRLNNDSAANYDRQIGRANNLTASALSNAAGTDLATSLIVSTGSGSANSFGLTVCQIPFYAASASLKVVQGTSSAFGTTGTNTTYFTDEWSALWRSTSAVSRVSAAVITGGKNFQVGSRMVVYAT